MGAGKGKSRRVRSRVEGTREVVNGDVVMPSEDGTVLPAFVGATEPKQAILEQGDAEGLFMADKDEEGRTKPALFEGTFEDYAQTSQDLGLPIPQEDPHYYKSREVKEATLIMHSAMANGGRCFTIYGPPGTGKNTFIKQSFAQRVKMPLFEIDVGSSDELEAAIGYDGLEVQRSDDGTQIASETVEKRGKLTLAAQRGAVIVLNEITELPRGQLTMIHNMIGSGIGDNERFIVIKSPSAKEKEMMIPVHPDTVFFFTYNPERSDRRPHQALLSRSVNIHMGHGDEKNEAQILMHRVNAVLEKNKEFQKKRKENGKGAEVSLEEVEDTVKFMRVLRTAYENDHLAHEPDMRTSVMFEAARLIEVEKDEKKKDDEKNGVIPALGQLDFMFDQTKKPKTRRLALQNYAANHYDECKDMKDVNYAAAEDEDYNFPTP